MLEKCWKTFTMLENIYNKTHLEELNSSSKVRLLGYCFTPYQRLWVYNGAPLVAFTTRWGPGGLSRESVLRIPMRVVKGD